MDIDDYEYFYPDLFQSYILTIKSNTYKKHLKSLGKELFSILRKINSDSFIFLGDEKLAWRFRDGKYKNYKSGMEYFANESIGKNFTGGLVVDKESLIPFVKHLADLISTNGIVQYVHFTNKEQSLLGSICHYGNIHISSIDEKSDVKLVNAILSTRFEYLKGECENQFFDG
ncbi:hypothetical protein [Pedobacter rhodius]|uniref:Uncharacterized protein n=1 Tax=Pedobacter rhodius TaxID=3004098 RepID=A0ABT4KXT5_9SPHI|nr:hypothetical protein [Pedobacter sp. SJ11]MCZ4223037.1 hypothetical protein [Pedobacter sp. SJ11]